MSLYWSCEESISSSTYFFVLVCISVVGVGTIGLLENVLIPAIVSSPVLWTTSLSFAFAGSSTVLILETSSCISLIISLLTYKLTTAQARNECAVVPLILGSALSSCTQLANDLVIVQASPALAVHNTISLLVTYQVLVSTVSIHKGKLLIGNKSHSQVFRIILNALAHIQAVRLD